MTAHSSFPESGSPADAQVESNAFERDGNAPDMGHEVGSSRSDSGASDDENLKQYMERFFKAHNIGEFSADDQPVETVATVKTAEPDRDEIHERVDDSRAQNDAVVANVGSSGATQPIAPETGTESTGSRTYRDPEGSTKPPESADDLRVLRHLVNTNARHAIQLYAFSQSVWVMRVYLTLGLVSIVCSAGLLLTATDVTASPYLLGTSTFVVAAIACLRYLQIVRITGQASSRQRRSG